MDFSRRLTKPMIFSGLCLFFCSFAKASATEPASQAKDKEIAHRAIRLMDLSLQEYALGVSDGVIVNPAEYDEALVFIRLSRKLLESLDLGVTADAALKNALAAMEAKQSPEKVASAIKPARETLIRRFGAPVVEIPYGVSAEVGQTLFQTHCTACHQPGGRKIGDRVAPDLLAPDLLKDLTPLQMVTVIQEGIPDSPMSGWGARLTAYEIWSVVYSLLNSAFGPAPSYSETRQFPPPDPQKSLTDWLRVAESRGLSGTSANEFAAGALLVPLASGEDFTRRLILLASRISELSDKISKPDEVPNPREKLAFLYSEFEPLEGPLLARSISQGTLIEARFQALLREAEVLSREALRAKLSSLATAMRTVAETRPPSSNNAYALSFLILLREGLEVLLLMGTLLAVLKRMVENHRKFALWAGFVAGCLASGILFFALRWFIAVAGYQIAIEGSVLVLGSLVLMYVVVWLSRNLQLAHLKNQFRQVVTKSSSAIPIAAASFVVVFREGVETALFYQALLIYTGNKWVPVLAGAGVALLVLLFTGYLILSLSVRLPLKWFFGITGSLLFLMAISFLGKGIFALQTAGLLPMTVLSKGLTIDWLGVYPVAQTLIAQALMAVLVFAFVLYPFLYRRSPVQSRAP